MTIIYKYTNRTNGKVYVGKTIHPEYRKRRHRYDALVGIETAFARAIRKHGIEALQYEILCVPPRLF